MYRGSPRPGRDTEVKKYIRECEPGDGGRLRLRDPPAAGPGSQDDGARGRWWRGVLETERGRREKGVGEGRGQPLVEGTSGAVGASGS
jgi:hypothetical protein